MANEDRFNRNIPITLQVEGGGTLQTNRAEMLRLMNEDKAHRGPDGSIVLQRDAVADAQNPTRGPIGGIAQGITPVSPDELRRRLNAPATDDGRTNFAERLALLKQQREADLAAGRARAQELLPEGHLGRVQEGRLPETERLIQERQQLLRDMVARQQGLGAELLGERRQITDRLLAEREAERNRLLAGRQQQMTDLSGVQRTQLRERALQALNEQSQTALARTRALLGRSGRSLEDPSAVAQQRRILEQQLATEGDVIRDLELSEIERRDRLQRELEALTLQSRGGLEQLALTGRAGIEQLAAAGLGREQQLGLQGQAGLEQLIGAAQASELARQQINAERAARELSGRLQTEFGFAGLGATERFGLAQLQAAEEERRAAQEFQRESLRLQEKAIDKPPPPAPSGGGGTMLCTELHRQGLLSTEILLGDREYAGQLPLEVVQGYQCLARPIRDLMRKSKLITHCMAPLIRGWATEAAHRQGKTSKGSLLGKCIDLVGVPICRAVGSLLRRLA